MKTKLLLSLALLVAAWANAAEGYVSKSATGTTSATVYFPGGSQPARLTALDVTCDNATNAVTWAAATKGVTAAVAAADTASFTVVYANDLGTADVVLLQNAAEEVKELTINTKTALSYKKFDLREPAGAACPIGTVIRERVVSPAFTLLSDTAADPTAFLISNPATLASNAVVLALQTFPISRALTGDVSVVTTAACKTVTLTLGAKYGLSAGNTFREVNTNNTTVSVGYSYATNVLTVTSVIPFPATCDVVIEAPSGEIETNTVSATNASLLTLGAECSFPCPLGTRVNSLSATATYTLALPTSADTKTLVVTATNGLATGDKLVLVPTGSEKFTAVMTGQAVNTNVYTMTLGAALETNLFAGAIFYQLTNSYGVAKAAAATDFSLILSNSTGLADGDAIVITLAGVPYLRNIGSTPATYTLSLLGFSGALGLALAADTGQVWKLGTAESTLVGNATLRVNGEALRVADAWRPARLKVTGAAACSINSATVKYGP